MPVPAFSNRLPMATYASQPRMGLRPRSRQASWNATAPNMFPWSVTASAFMPSLAAWSTSSSTRHAPSSRLYSVCRWRCTNSVMRTTRRSQRQPQRHEDHEEQKSFVSSFVALWLPLTCSLCLRSFPFDGGRGLAGDVVDHAVDAADLVHD